MIETKRNDKESTHVHVHFGMSAVILFLATGAIGAIFQNGLNSQAKMVDEMASTFVQQAKASTKDSQVTEGPIIPVSIDLGVQTVPDISDQQKVVWFDSRSGLRIYDLTTRTEQVISSTFLAQGAAYPKIDNDNIAFLSSVQVGSPYVGRVSLLNPTIGTYRTITTQGNAFNVDISGNDLVYRDLRFGSGFDIFAYNLLSGTEERLTSVSSFQYDPPSVNERKAVWVGPLSSIGLNVFLQNLETGIGTWITSRAGQNIRYPTISGNRIVWQELVGGNWEIFLYDISTGTERRLTFNTVRDFNPVIAGENIVWERELLSSGFDIVLYSLNSSQEYVLTSHPSAQRYPVVSGAYAVWQDMRNGNWDIYAADINQAPVLSFIPDQTVAVGQNLSFTVSATDPDGDTPLLYSVNGVPEGAQFDPATQIFSWTPFRGEIGTHAVTFTVTDPSGYSDSQVVQITVTRGSLGGGR